VGQVLDVLDLRRLPEPPWAVDDLRPERLGKTLQVGDLPHRTATPANKPGPGKPVYTAL